MSETTKIQWCDHTFNPWRGCARVSDGCRHCYAETLSKRNPKVLGTWGVDGTRAIGSEAYWREPLRWHRAAVAAGERRRVFCASLADVFEDRPDVVDARLRLFEVIEATPMLDWLLLTKRPEHIARLMPKYFEGEPWPNVWLGTSVENQACADERIPVLLQTPAAVRFVSYEPALEYVDFRRVRWPDKGEHRVDVLRGGFWSVPIKVGIDGFVNHSDFPATLDWIIFGLESGPNARAGDVDWGRDLIAQCADTKTAVFIKQFGTQPFDSARTASGRSELLKLRDKKGGDIAEFPSDLKVREFPNRQHERKRA